MGRSGSHVAETALKSLATNLQENEAYNVIEETLTIICKLREHFGELAASDLLAVQTELSLTKQGPYLLRKLDIDRFANWPDQWRSKQASKQSTYKDFYAAFGSSEKTKSLANDSFLAEASKNTSRPKELKKMRKEIDDHLASEKYAKHAMAKNKKGHASSEIVGTSQKAEESIQQIPFLSVDMKGKKRQR